MNHDELASKAANTIGVTPHSDMRPFVEQAVKWALNEAALSAAEPVKTPFEIASQRIPEARVSLISRAIRQGLNDYGWKNFGTLPEVLMGYIVEAEKAEAIAHPPRPKDCGKDGGDLSERRDNIGSAYTRAAPPAPSVAVKALEWRRGSTQHRQVASVFDRPMYEVGIDNGRWYWLHNWNGLALRRVDSENEAIAAAQADYEARILSALSAQVQDEPGRKPLDLNITKEWFEKRAALEGDHEIGAGRLKLMAGIDPSSEEGVDLHLLAYTVPEGWQLVPIKPTTDMAYAAACAHYGKKRVDQTGIEGISMTVNNIDYNFSAAFRRFWKGALSAVPAKQEGCHD